MVISAEEADQALSKVRQGLWILEQRFQQLQAELKTVQAPAPVVSAPQQGSTRVLASEAQRALIMRVCGQLDCQLPDLDRTSKQDASEWIERHLHQRKELLGY
jgi:hypothetical protein